MKVKLVHVKAVLIPNVALGVLHVLTHKGGLTYEKR